MIAQFNDGQIRDYGTAEQFQLENLWNMIDAIRLSSPLFCTGETALLQTLAVEGMRAVQPDAQVFPDRMISSDSDMKWVEGLAPSLWRAFDTATLPELGQEGLYFPS